MNTCLSKRTFIRLLAVLGLALVPIHAHAATSIVWNSTTVLKGKVIIPVGQSVTVAPHTKLVVKDGTRITVNGTLTAPAGLSLSGKSWDGLVIIGKAVLTNFQESGASTSFRVGPTGSLTIHGGTISGILGSSVVEGTFVADSLHYDKGAGGGITSNNGTGSITIDHSDLTGAGRNTGDFFGLYGVKSISLTNSTMTGSKTITNTHIKDNQVGFDEGSASTHNGLIVISNSTITSNGRDLGLYTGKVKIQASVATK
jgi:hypothetical protein